MKAILVIDMPDACINCRYHRDGKCQIVNKVTYAQALPDEQRVFFCPLRPLPKEKVELLDDTCESCWNDGYNTCLDEIMGEDNG